MAYCETCEVRDMIKDDALNVIIGDEYIADVDVREEKIAPIVANAITDAEGEIDGYLAKRYPIPLVPVPKSINKMAKDIAVYNLFSRIGIDESKSEKNYLNRYNAAISFLKLIANGSVDIGITATAKTAATGFNVRSNPRLFNRSSMKGL